MSKEPKDERFIRLAEARVNKIIKMVRLLGNLSWSSNYEYTTDQVAQIRDELTCLLDIIDRKDAKEMKNYLTKIRENVRRDIEEIKG